MSEVVLSSFFSGESISHPTGIRGLHTLMFPCCVCVYLVGEDRICRVCQPKCCFRPGWTNSHPLGKTLNTAEIPSQSKAIRGSQSIFDLNNLTSPEIVLRVLEQA